ncbi:MAG: phosphatase PAP2 family protein [Chloroflexi bacterium]|nr:phosphatase PAP2 family protein [Chloroflexota bacterium]
MNDLIQWGLAVVQWIQTFRNPVFDLFFATINFLGEEDFYILFLPLLFWCLHKTLGLRLGVILMFSTYVNQTLKDFFAAPRPYQVDNKLYAPFKTTGYGIPSGHSQSTATFWGFFATQLKTRVAWIIAIAIPFFVGIGRMYLGDHFPQDVLLGWMLGIVIVAVYAWIQPRASNWIGAQSFALQIAIAIIAPLALFALHPTIDTAKSIGVLIGFYAGAPVEARWIRFDARAAWLKQVIKFALGLAILLALRFGLKAIFPQDVVLFDFIRYAAMGVWVSIGAPFVFVRARLAQKMTTN